jgi:hypothetical protein
LNLIYKPYCGVELTIKGDKGSDRGDEGEELLNARQVLRQGRNQLVKVKEVADFEGARGVLDLGSTRCESRTAHSSLELGKVAKRASKVLGGSPALSESSFELGAFRQPTGDDDTIPPFGGFPAKSQEEGEVVREAARGPRGGGPEISVMRKDRGGRLEERTGIRGRRNIESVEPRRARCVDYTCTIAMEGMLVVIHFLNTKARANLVEQGKQSRGGNSRL